MTLLQFFTTHWLGQLIVIVAQCLAITIPLLVSVAYMTYVDRKVWAAIQLRRGPNVVGPFGLLQPFADGLKLVLKETIIPSGANKVLFILAPMITFITALIAWAVVPFDDGWVVANINVRQKTPFEQLDGVNKLVAEAEAAVQSQDGRLLLRYSGTEPKARLLIEGRDAKLLQSWSNQICDAIRRQIGA